MTMFGSYLSSLYSLLTLHRRCGLAYPYDWRGFLEATEKTSVGLLVFNLLGTSPTMKYFFEMIRPVYIVN
jgi:hypothetical protein